MDVLDEAVSAKALMIEMEKRSEIAHLQSGSDRTTITEFCSRHLLHGSSLVALLDASLSAIFKARLEADTEVRSEQLT